MTHRGSPFVSCIVLLASMALVTSAVLAVAGYFPAKNVAGSEGAVSMLAGIGASLIATLAGAIPIAMGVTGGSQNSGMAILAATTVRFLVMLALVVVLVLGGWFDKTVLVVAAAASYLLLLLADTTVTVQLMKRYSETKQG